MYLPPLYSCLFWTFYIKGLTHYVVFCAWLLWLRSLSQKTLMFLRFVPVVACTWHSIVRLGHFLFTCSSVDRLMLPLFGYYEQMPWIIIIWMPLWTFWETCILLWNCWTFLEWRYHFAFPISSVCCCLISQSCSTLSRPQGLQLLVSQSIGLPGQDDWSGLPFPSAGIFLA